MGNKILFEGNEDRPLKSGAIPYSQLKVGLRIIFQNEEDAYIPAQVADLYTDEEDENRIIGCAVADSQGTMYALYEEDGTVLFTAGAAIEPDPESEPENYFIERTEAEQDNSKYPEWDILPPNQFLNPRVKKQ